MKIIFFSLIFLCALVSEAASEKRSCDNTEFIVAEEKLVAFERTIKKVESPWTELSAVFAVWEPCMAKFQDEAFIDVIAKVAVARWVQVIELEEIKTKNPNFYKYVIFSLGDVTVGAKRWDVILENVKNKCPKAAKKTCGEIQRAHRTH